MIIKYSVIICVLLVLLAAITAGAYGREISAFLSCIAAFNDVAAPSLKKFAGLLGLTMVGLTVVGVIRFIADQADSP